MMNGEFSSIWMNIGLILMLSCGIPMFFGQWKSTGTSDEEKHRREQADALSTLLEVQRKVSQGIATNREIIPESYVKRQSWETLISTRIDS